MCFSDAGSAELTLSGLGAMQESIVGHVNRRNMERGSINNLSICCERFGSCPGYVVVA